MRALRAGSGEDNWYCKGYDGARIRGSEGRSKIARKDIRLHVAKCRATMYGYPRG